MSTVWLDEVDFGVARSQVWYCPSCADVYGSVASLSKRCGCEASLSVPETSGGFDFPTPFEICWYCQAEIIRSGSKWATYYCDDCRPRVIALNDWLDSRSLVSLPVGRHSLMHTRWAYARPFTTYQEVRRWKETRLRAGWRSYSEHTSSTAWADFGAYLRLALGDAHEEELLALVVSLQSVPADWINQSCERSIESRRD